MKLGICLFSRWPYLSICSFDLWLMERNLVKCQRWIIWSADKLDILKCWNSVKIFWHLSFIWKSLRYNTSDFCIWYFYKKRENKTMKWFLQMFVLVDPPDNPPYSVDSTPRNKLRHQLTQTWQKTLKIINCWEEKINITNKNHKKYWFFATN